MTFLVETVPTLEAAEERLAAIVGRIQRAPTERVNILTGSNVQRIYYRRMLAGRLGATANVRLFTPIDLAAEIRGAGAPPVRLPLPEGGDVLLVEAILHRLQGQRGLRRLNPAIRGVSEAVGAALTDLREGAIGAAEYRAALRRTDDPKLHDLGAVYQAFEEEPPFLDRPAVFQDALDPRISDGVVRQALGEAPLVVVGIYDATPVQAELLRRCAAAVDVQVLLVAPSDPDFRFARRFADTLRAAGATAIASAEAAGEFDQPPATAAYFSAPSRQAEAEEIARRLLQLAREEGVPFNEMAVVHRLDQGYDDLVAAALTRAGIPHYRAAGVPIRHTPAGRAILVLLDLLLEEPIRHRLLEFLASPALREQVPPGVPRTPVLWERLSKQAGMVAGWERFATQLSALCDRLRDPERPPFERERAEDLRRVVQHLAAAADRRVTLGTWQAYSDWFLAVVDAFLAPSETAAGDPVAVVRSRIEGLAQLDQAGLPVEAARFKEGAARAIRRAVLSGGAFQRDGVFLGSLVAARWLRFQAVFVAECAERIFPPLIRQDPLLLDSERERLNRRLRRAALPLMWERLHEEQLLFALAQQAADRFLTLSWARRTSVTGAPRLPSSFLLGAIREEIDELAEVDDLEAQRVITRLPARLAGAAPSLSEAVAGNWSVTARALDEADFRLAVLEPAPTAAPESLRRLWPGYARYEAARAARNEPRFTDYDGVIPPERLSRTPLAGALAPTSLEEYATCPYRYFLKHVLKVGAVAEPGEALEMTPLDRGTLVHTILERWVQDAIDQQADWPAYLQNEAHLFQIAQEQFVQMALSGLSGLPATWEIVRGEILSDLQQVIALERERAAAGYRPLQAELPFDDVRFDLPDGSQLAFRGRIDRVDQGPEGIVAIDYKSGSARRQAEDYRSGVALQLPIYLAAAARQYGVDREQVEAEYWYATRRGNFTHSGLRGAAVLHDPEFWATLESIAAGIRAGRFFPYPGEGARGQRRPNCTYCDYFPVCATDVDARFDMKARQDQATVREFRGMQAKR